MNSKAQSLIRAGWMQIFSGIVLLAVATSMLTTTGDPFNVTLGVTLLAAGSVVLLAGLLFCGMAIVVREPSPVVVAQPQYPYPHPQV